MSDLSIYELEDIIWDEFGRSEDHIVPYSGDENTKELSSLGESRKKPRFEELGISDDNNDNCAVECVSQENEETDFSAVNTSTGGMLEKGSWSHSPADEMFSASCDTNPIKQVTSVASEKYRMSNQYFSSKDIDSLDELCSDDPILSGGCTAVDSNSYNYQLAHISQTEGGFCFADHAHEGKESSDLLYYDFPDIESFEDGGMYGGCDSSFALGSSSKEDEVGWYSASDVIEGYEDPSKLGFKFSCSDSSALANVSDGIEPSRMENETSSINGTSMKSSSVSFKASSWCSEMDEPALVGNLSSVNGYSQISKSKDDIILKDQVVSEVKFRTSENDNGSNQFHERQQKQKEWKRKDKHVENGSSSGHPDNQKNKGAYLSGDASQKAYTSFGVQPQNRSLRPTSFDYLHNNNPHMHSDYHQPLEQMTVCPELSGIKSETSTRTSLSQNESSHASNGVRPKDYNDFRFDGTAVSVNEIRGKLPHLQGFQVSFESNSEHVDLAAIRNPASGLMGNNFECQSNIERVVVPAELGLLNVQESSSTSGLNEVSLEVTGFRQLQEVIKQLDTRTKLCIRDSLYRLARSAEQRHNNANLNDGHGDDRDARIVITEGTNKSSGFMDIETDTNPIDRTIAHLLFHRPTDASMIPSPKVSLKSRSSIPGSGCCPAVMVEKMLCREESAVETKKKVDEQ